MYQQLLVHVSISISISILNTWYGMVFLFVLKRNYIYTFNSIQVDFNTESTVYFIAIYMYITHVLFIDYFIHQNHERYIQSLAIKLKKEEEEEKFPPLTPSHPHHKELHIILPKYTLKTPPTSQVPPPANQHPHPLY